MKRRDFIRNIALTGAAFAGTPFLGAQFIPLAEAVDIPKFSFAHITDLHLDVKGSSTWQFREKSVPLFIDALRQLGKLHKLDYHHLWRGPGARGTPRAGCAVRIPGVDEAARSSLLHPAREHGGVAVPGVSKLLKEDYLLAWRGRGVGPGRPSWSVEPVRGVRIIGFDVTVEGKRYGEAGPAALEWLVKEVDASRKMRLVIVVTHQLLLPTTPRDTTPEWALWMVRNHAVVREVLDRYPNVRMVISGHHHTTKVETQNHITYVADPAIITYPMRLPSLQRQPRGDPSQEHRARRQEHREQGS